MKLPCRFAAMCFSVIWGLSFASTPDLAVGSTFEFPIDVAESFLNGVSNLGQNPETVIDLATIDATPGEILMFEVLGEFSLSGLETPSNPNIATAAIGVFSGSSTLLAFDQAAVIERVVDAIDAGVDIDTSPSQDIAEDFALGGSFPGGLSVEDVAVEVPIGATHLFVSAFDGFFLDNSDADSNFAVRITVVPEPGSLALLGVGAIGCMLLQRNR
ncbi:MAG: PEP-CTERM sorting domain-containing protein [Planctomycetota bacterium]